MEIKYDMCIEYEALCAIEEKMRTIGADLSESTEKMLLAIQASQGFLAGNQFEKAKRTTLNCIEVTAKTSNNINNALLYIAELREKLESYEKCKYVEGAE